MRETTGRLQRPDGEAIAWRRIEGKGPTVVWLGGFRSDMTGTKAQVLSDWAQEAGHAYLRFDYYGHGESSGDFAAGGCIGRWREDVLAVIDGLTEGPLVLVGSSMGGWLSLLAAAARPDRIQALVLVAPAPDFTERLMKTSLPADVLETIARDGQWLNPAGFPITRRLLEDGAEWLVLPGPLAFAGPVRILQGGRDDAVPAAYAQQLVDALPGDDVVFTLVKDGDHRLSRPRDLLRLVTAVEDLVATY